MEVPMSTILSILARYKERTRARFLEVVLQEAAVPEKVAIPRSPEEALRLGILLGRHEGYREGLVDGTKLGLDVGCEAADAVMSQPVIFGPTGLA
jgi:hypothetical protein